MPVTLAHVLGNFEAEGVAVTVDRFTSTSKTMEALIGGSADVITNSYEQTLQLIADGRALRMFFVIQGRDGRALVALPNRPGIRSLRDLKGKRLGVPSPGSANHLYANLVLQRIGIRLEDFSVAGIGIGASAIAALERGLVDAAAVSIGALLYLKKKYPTLTILSDATTAEGTRELWGTDFFPGIGLVSRSEWLERHPDHARKIARAVNRATAWLRDHPPEQTLPRIPTEFLTNDHDLNLESLRAIKTIWSKDGRMLPEGPETVRRGLAQVNEKIRNASIDLSKTYTNEFVGDTK